MTPNVGTNAAKGKANFTPNIHAGKMGSHQGSNNDVYGLGQNKYRQGGPGGAASANKRFTMN